MAQIDKVFAGSIPRLYDTLLVPLIFEIYAAHTAALVAAGVRIPRDPGHRSALMAGSIPP